PERDDREQQQPQRLEEFVDCDVAQGDVLLLHHSILVRWTRNRGCAVRRCASELEVERRAEIVDHRRDALASVNENMRQFGRTGLAIAELAPCGEVLALDVVDEFVIRIVAARRPAQRVAADLERARELLAAHRLFPGRRIVDEEIAHALQRRRLGMPETAAYETAAGL